MRYQIDLEPRRAPDGKWLARAEVVYGHDEEIRTAVLEHPDQRRFDSEEEARASSLELARLWLSGLYSVH